MSSSLSQGSQSFLEPGLVTEQQVLCPKVATSESIFSKSFPRSTTKIDEDLNKTQQNAGGWSFLQSLNINHIEKKNRDETEQIYVHPLDKKSSSALSEKSLEMCTESLGSETGSENNDDIPLLWLENAAVYETKEFSKPKETFLQKKRSFDTRTTSFPPPITSISGSGVKVKTYREGGRLVLKAVSASSSSSPNGYFHADRSEGRLRLCFSKDSSMDFQKEEINSLEEEEENEEQNSTDNDIYEEKEEISTDEEVYEKEEETLFDEDAYEEEEEEEIACYDEAKDGNSEMVEGKMGMGKLCRPCSRWKEGGTGGGGHGGRKSLLSWEQFWVAT